MSTLIDLNRVTYMKPTPSQRTLNYMSAKYLNIRFVLAPERSMEVKAADAANLPGIAHREYGSREYWWVIGLYNGILDPVTDLVPGVVLQLPSLTDINAFLAADEKSAETNIVIV